jgi:predicted RNase H-like nuclease (RuvC/YqgF family)
MSLKDRLKRLKRKVSTNNVIPDDDDRATLKITGETTEEAIQNALNTIRDAKENNIKWHWLNIQCPEGVNIHAVVVAIIKELNKDKWGDAEI